ncbi:PhzF family phenazine biosynthesis protein [Neptunicoccus cionae]|uniref:PhzF family phenazine biosynthesis protein n=1 Tax=Neptunicoccus cionae TaxID=2035344 RepID=UPI000C76F24B|nr:PhzF family phenazine biosynthesis protein [Amylibacter cionae]PLS20903.1 PhzF family phenazine biosynthesis protein [Amylibacter cionae]
MQIQRIAAFSLDGAGGNPAGVVVTDALPSADEMQKIAAEVGYSETVFAAPQGGGYRVRYFAPQAEVAFCGHATIALGAALGAAHGAGTYQLALNDADISVEAFQSGTSWAARLSSPPTRQEPALDTLKADVLALFGWTEQDLDSALEIKLVEGGARHLLVPLRNHGLLRDMSYDFDEGAALMQAHSLVTINLVYRQDAETFFSRNAFAGHGVYEDPATGAAGAALAGYLRDSGRGETPFTIYQGQDMDMPSRLVVTPETGKGAPVRVEGETRQII